MATIIFTCDATMTAQALAGIGASQAVESPVWIKKTEPKKPLWVSK